MRKEHRPRRRAAKVALGGVIGLAVALGWCGRDWFIGAGGWSGLLPESLQRQVEQLVDDAPPAPSRCRLRIDGAGLQLDLQPATVEQAVERCRASGEAELVITGEARYGTVQQVEQALREAGVRVVSGPGNGVDGALPMGGAAGPGGPDLVAPVPDARPGPGAARRPAPP
jgi:hypothetical protein